MIQKKNKKKKKKKKKNLEEKHQNQNQKEKNQNQNQKEKENIQMQRQRMNMKMMMQKSLNNIRQLLNQEWINMKIGLSIKLCHSLNHIHNLILHCVIKYIMQ